MTATENERLRKLCRTLWVWHMQTVGLVPTKCEHCGATIVPTRTDMRFCSKTCGVRHHEGKTHKKGPKPPERQTNGSPFYRYVVGEMEALGIEVMRWE